MLRRRWRCDITDLRFFRTGDGGDYGGDGGDRGKFVFPPPGKCIPSSGVVALCLSVANLDIQVAMVAMVAMVAEIGRRYVVIYYGLSWLICECVRHSILLVQANSSIQILSLLCPNKDGCTYFPLVPFALPRYCTNLSLITQLQT